ncbi:pilus assembly protein PilM [Kroppenstedtia pulmonis]|uniref:Pilus assembly protein PilM n=1 Tax=Kroppenstedtia pulmonis TaxID=1380685 RepID=A0A7D4CPH6_9BACL|nr:pilus assembly protein PilM [Kroppenstedtia pulmonis]QKG85338.1 pilus assembly protein PilM [Kroppenstedtia pulmonis]
MPMFQRFALGMELTDSLYKLVEVKKGMGRIRMTQYVVHPLLPVWRDGNDWTEPEELIQTIRDSLTTRRLRTRRVHLTLNNRNVITGLWRIPEMNKQRMHRWIQHKVLPAWDLPFSDPLFDFQTVGHVWQEGDRQEVVVAVASRRYVEELLKLLRFCNLEPVSVDLAALSLYRWLDYAAETPVDKSVILHLTREGVEVSLFQYGGLQGCTFLTLPMDDFLKGRPDRPSIDPLTPVLTEDDQLQGYRDALIRKMKEIDPSWMAVEAWRPNRRWILTGEGVDMHRLQYWMQEGSIPSVQVATGPQTLMSEKLQMTSSRWLGASLSVPLGAALKGVGVS